MTHPNEFNLKQIDEDGRRRLLLLEQARRAEIDYQRKQRTRKSQPHMDPECVVQEMHEVQEKIKNLESEKNSQLLRLTLSRCPNLKKMLEVILLSPALILRRDLGSVYSVNDKRVREIIVREFAALKKYEEKSNLGESFSEADDFYIDVSTREIPEIYGIQENVIRILKWYPRYEEEIPF